YGAESRYKVVFNAYGNDLNESNFIDDGLRNVVYFRDLINSSSVFKGSNGVFRGNPHRYGTVGYGVVDSANTGDTTKPVYVGRNSSLEITSTVNGLGNAEYNQVKAGKSIVQPKTSANQVVEEIRGYNDNIIKQVYSNGAIYGKMTMASDYMINYFVPFAVKTSAGPPTGSPDGKVGVGVINTLDSKIYFHVGGGVWKSVDLT